MAQLKITPKDGWKYATDSEMQMFCANEIGAAHCINPKKIHDLFESLGVNLVPVMHKFMGGNINKSNPILLCAVLGDDLTEIKNYLDISN